MNVAEGESSKQKKKTKKRKGQLPRFPKRPDTLISSDQIPTRIKQLEKYLSNLLNITLYRNHYDTIHFLEVSNFSFINALGEKGRETSIKKRTGSTNPGQKKCNFLNCLTFGCCIRCNLICGDLICGTWQSRWLIVKETFLALQNPKTGAVRSVILFDNGFDISLGLYSTGLNSGLQLVTNSKYLVLKFSSKKQAKEWATYLKMIAVTSARDFTSPNTYNSFAPTRPSTLCGWFVDGASYMSAVADAIEGAVEEIYIADWWLSPEIYMKRPTLDGEYWRLDKILLRKAKQGIRIFILLYKEVEMALGINSFYSKQKLGQLHENIKLLRHPDHVRIGVFFWAHHEKLVVVDQTYAFVGGIDLCYGRWDDHHHRLTDLGSISMISNRSPSVRSFTVIENPIRSLIMQSKGILQATASPSSSATTITEIQTLSITTTRNLTVIEETNENDQTISEHTKQNTPEMKRRGITEKIKENVVHMNRSLMNRLSSPSEPQAPTTSQAVEIETPTHVEVDGQAKYWIGKDYTNFILKDFTELNQPFADLIDRTKTPRMPWHDIASVVVGQASRDVARHFIERWNACKLEKARDNLSYPYLMPKSYNDIRIDHNFWPKTKVHLDRVTCQVLRSSASWSAGFIESDYYEESIHEAYVENIAKAQHYIYIENQFFISLGFPDTVVKNQIAESLYKRIIRAHRSAKKDQISV
jgi:phospholipase D1/2